MHKNKLFRLFLKVLIVLFSYGYIYYKLESTSIDWQVFNSVNIYYLLLALILMPLNWFFESYKWRFLLQDIQKINLKTSFRGILIGITSGMATPNRVGEYIGRTFVLEKNNRVKGSLATMLGSLSQVLITLTLGLLAWLFLFEDIRFFDKLHYRPIFMASLIVLMVTMLLFFYNLQWIKRLAHWLSINQKYIDQIRFLNNFKARELSYVLFLSFFRYVIFASQYVLLLWAFGIDVALLKSLSAIALSYLIIVFIPHFSITELGVRGSVAVLVFQNFTSDLHLVAMAAGLLWLINISVPTIMGSIFLMSSKVK